MPGALAIPAAETESQNWIGMCDCVITKCGYSTVSEAVRAEIPLFVWKREGFIEDEAIAGTIEKLGIGRSLDATESAIESCLRDGPSLEKYKERFDTIDRQFKENGAPAIIRAVQRLLG